MISTNLPGAGERQFVFLWREAWMPARQWDMQTKIDRSRFCPKAYLFYEGHFDEAFSSKHASPLRTGWHVFAISLRDGNQVIELLSGEGYREIPVAYS